MKEFAMGETQMASFNSKQIRESIKATHMNHYELSEATHKVPIGNEFQVEVPPISGDSSDHFLVGLPLPIFCQHAMVSENAVENENFANGERFEISYLVPGLFTEQWSDAEKASFLLGLYIFQKDFVQVRRFIETKEMGAIMSFYYGEFYRSDVYRRWSDGQKENSKICVYGIDIFSGQKQQELLSRLLPNISENHRDALLEVFRRFRYGRMSLAAFVSSVKGMVGMSTLVEAIGIGTGKKDLTTMTEEPSRSIQVGPTLRPKIPTGKACSKLTASEIIKFISGDYHLSKCKSNDLFWEAVWPRLLANGWHSEHRNKRVLHIAGEPQNGLVFLAPGVMEFSRRELVRGDDYFDSVTDVLKEVAKEPDLIQLEEEEGDGENNLEVSTSGRRSYLQPRRYNRDADIMLLTVVDTSLSGGKVRELRDLPLEISSSLTYQSRSEEIEESVSEMLPGISNSIPVGNLKKGTNQDRKGPVRKKSRKATPSMPDPGLENRMSSSTSISSASSLGDDTRMLIDLNVPPPELENAFRAEALIIEKESQTLEADVRGIVNLRRHGTRARPPTARALEAVADGYLTISRKRKSKGKSCHDEVLSHRSQ